MQGYISSSEEEPTINLTPLIDVVFVILITFMVVAPMLEMENIELASGSSVGKNIEIKEKSEVSIQVLHDDKILFNNQQVTVEQLHKVLKESKIKNPLVRPQIYHDKRAKFGTYQEIKNAAENAGYEEMDIVVKPG